MAAETAAYAIYCALSSAEPYPKVVHASIEKIRELGGHNVIATIGARLTELKAKIGAQGARIKAEIKAQTVGIDAQSARVDVL